MERLFQHYEGQVKEIENLILKGLKALVDDNSDGENVILLWLESDKFWLRIFIDCAYCGIDSFSYDNSIEDLEEGYSYVTKTKWVENLIIQKALVKYENQLITLTVELTNGHEIIFSCDKNEHCQLKRNVR